MIVVFPFCDTLNFSFPLCFCTARSAKFASFAVPLQTMLPHETWPLPLTVNTSLVISDASNFANDPVARVKLPQRVPFGFHGSWIPDAD